MNKKREVRTKLLEIKRRDKTLRKELQSINKLSARALEIRKILGLATMQELLGDKYPIRICKYCGKRAYSKDDLWDFQYSITSKHQHNNCCTSCIKLRELDKSINIVGLHSMLNLPKQCLVCRRPEVGTGSRSWFIRKSKVCKYCLGTHEETFGYPIKLPKPKPLAYQGTPIVSYVQLAELVGIPYRKTRYLLLQNQIKGVTWIV